MSSQEPKLDQLVAALQSDLPSERELERMHARLLAAGVALSAGSVVSSAAAAKASVASSAAIETAGVSVGAKLASMSLAGKIGWSAVVIASASALSVAPQWTASRAPAQRTKPAATAHAGVAANAAPAKVEATSAAAPASHAPALAVPAPAAVAVAATPANEPNERRAEATPPPRVASPSPSPSRSPALASSSERVAPTEDLGSSPMASLGVERTSPLPSSLRAEAELLQGAIAALHAGDRLTAQRTLAVHAQRFPDGALRRERERIESHLDGMTVEIPEPTHVGGHEHD